MSDPIQGIDEFGLCLVSLCHAMAVRQREPIHPWTERRGTLLWILLVLAVRMMLILILRNLKEPPSSPRSHTISLLFTPEDSEDLSDSQSDFQTVENSVGSASGKWVSTIFTNFSKR
jgi:hypothetical protein